MATDGLPAAKFVVSLDGAARALPAPRDLYMFFFPRTHVWILMSFEIERTEDANTENS